MFLQEVAALHQRHRVRIHLCDVLPIIFGETHDAVRDAEFMLAHNLHAAFAHQFIVVEQRPCNRVLNRHHANHTRVLLHLVKHLLERVAANQLDVLILEVAVARHIVVTANLSLYRNSSHIIYNIYIM